MYPIRFAMACVLVLLFSIVAMPLCADDDIVNGQISQLASDDNTVRAAAAAELRRLLAGDFNARTNDHGRLYWQERLSQVRPGMKHDEVLRILPPVDKNISGEGSGQTHGSSWRLDDYWVVNVYYNNPDVVHEMRPELARRVRAVWVDPPANFSGKWATWHVNGQAAQEVDYQNGKYHGTFVTFHDNGRRAVEQHYESGSCAGADCGWYADGSKMYVGQYLYGKQTGTWTHWYQDGRLQSRAEMKGGEYHGARESWHQNGQKQYEEHYQFGKKEGTDQSWDRDGKLQWSRVFRNDQLLSSR